MGGSRWSSARPCPSRICRGRNPCPGGQPRCRKAAHLVLSFAEDAAHGGLIGSGFRNLGFSLGENLVQRAAVRRTEFVEATLAVRRSSTRPALQLRQMRGDGTLAHRQNLLQFGTESSSLRSSSRMRSRLGSAATRRIFTIEAIIHIDAERDSVTYQHITI